VSDPQIGSKITCTVDKTDSGDDSAKVSEWKIVYDSTRKQNSRTTQNNAQPYCSSKRQHLSNKDIENNGRKNKGNTKSKTTIKASQNDRKCNPSKEIKTPNPTNQYQVWISKNKTRKPLQNKKSNYSIPSSSSSSSPFSPISSPQSKHCPQQ